MARQGSGLTDKLYWRPTDMGTYHCFKSVRDPDTGCRYYASLCDEEEIDRSDGQSIRRPSLSKRCEECNASEMERRGWQEPGPQT